MATPIVVNPTKPSQVVVGGGTQSGTPIKVTTDLDYNRVQSMINESIDSIDTSDLAKENTLRQGITSISAEIVNTTNPLAKEATLTHGVDVISQKIDDIHIPELDKSDLAKEATLLNGISNLSNKIDNIDLSSVENKVDEGVETLSNKIDNIDTSHLAKESSLNETKTEIVEAVNNAKPDIDLSAVAKESTLNSVSEKLDNLNVEVDLSTVAKQGDDKNATLTAIYKMLVGNDGPSQDIPEGVAERLALILEFFGIKPIQAYEFMTAEEVCSTLEDIMTSMDLELTPEKAAEITSNTLNN